MNPISIITFADLGKKKNLKTIDILPVIDLFISRGILDCIICRINTGFFFERTNAVIPRILHITLKGLEKITAGKCFARNIEESLFDKWTFAKLGNSKTALFHPEYFFGKTVTKLKKKGVVTIGIATMAHLNVNAQLEQEEQELLGIPTTDHYYRDLILKNGSLPDFDYVIAVSEFVKKTYIENGFPKENIFVAELDVEVNAHNVGNPCPDSFIAVYTAHTSLLKGLHYLLEAWKTLSITNKKLIIIGGFKEIPADLRSRIDELIRTDSTIEFVGQIGHAQVGSYYENASVFVFPSLTEGNPKVVLEALSYGLPVITTVNAKSLVVDGQNGFVIPIRDSVAIAEKLNFLATHPEKMKALSHGAFSSIRNKKPFAEGVLDACREIEKRGCL